MIYKKPYQVQSEKISLFASAWDFQNLDLLYFRIFLPPKIMSTNRKQPVKHDGDTNKVYLNITDTFYLIAPAIRKWRGY